MGKVLVINGADFSANKVEKITLGNFLKKNVTKFGFVYMASFTLSESWGITSGASIWPAGRVVIVDVSEYIGHTLRIYTTQVVLASAAGSIVRGRIGFTSDLGNTILDNLLAMEPTTDRTVRCQPTLVTLVQESPVTQDDYHTYQVQVPTTANWLIISHDSSNAVPIDDIQVEVID